jgi:hypothetical protein
MRQECAQTSEQAEEATSLLLMLSLKIEAGLLNVTTVTQFRTPEGFNEPAASRFKARRAKR